MSRQEWRAKFAKHFNQPMGKEEIFVPDIGNVWVRLLSGAEVAMYRASLWRTDRSGNKDLDLRRAEASLCVLCLCDDQGERVFEDGEADDFNTLPNRAIAQIYSKCQELNGLTKEDIDFFVQNSKPIQSGNSSTNCAPTSAA